jgi:hypothetical protein
VWQKGCNKRNQSQSGWERDASHEARDKNLLLDRNSCNLHNAIVGNEADRNDGCIPFQGTK